MSNPPDVLDHAEQHLANAGRDAKAYHILHNSGAAAVFVSIGAAQMAEVNRRVNTVAIYEALRQIDDENGYRFVRHGAQDRPCRNIREVCEAVGFPKDKFYLLGQEINAYGAKAAQMLEEGGVTRRVRRALIQAPPKLQKAVVQVINQGGDQAEVGRQISDLVNAYVAEAKDRADGAARDADASRRRATKAEHQADELKGRLAVEREGKKEADQVIRELRDKLNTPGFVKGNEEIAELLEAVRGSLLGDIGKLERAADALAVRVDNDEPNPELNQLALRLLELATNLWGSTFGKYLPVLDPGQEYTPLWAAHATFMSAGTQEELDQYQAAGARKRGSKS